MTKKFEHIKPGDKLYMRSPERAWGGAPQITYAVFTVQRLTAIQVVTTRDHPHQRKEYRFRIADGRIIGGGLYGFAEEATPEILAQHAAELELLTRWRKAVSALDGLIDKPLHQLKLNTAQLERLAAAWAEVQAMGGAKA